MDKKRRRPVNVAAIISWPGNRVAMEKYGDVLLENGQERIEIK